MSTPIHPRDNNISCRWMNKEQRYVTEAEAYARGGWNVSYDIYVITGRDAEGACIFEYVSSSSADIGEIVTACQVLFPDMEGVCIEPPETETP